MNTIRIYLQESGSIAELYKDFRLYSGQFQNKLLQVYVPKSIIYETAERNTYLTNVKVGAITTNEKGQKITTKSYAMVYTAEETINDIVYEVYERKLPKEFCVYAGTQKIVVNVENIDNTTSKVLSVITSQIANLEVQDSAELDNGETIEPTELETINGQINDLYEAIGLGDVDYKDILNRVEDLEDKSDDYVTLNTEQTITATKTFDLPMSSGLSANKGIIFKKGSGGGIAPEPITFKNSSDMTIGVIAMDDNRINIEGIINYSNGNSIMNLSNNALKPGRIGDETNNGLDLGSENSKWEDLYLSNQLKDGTNSVSVADIPTTIEALVNPTNYVMTTTLKNASGTVVSTATVDLPLESMVVSGSYDDTTKQIVLTLQNGNTVTFSVADLVDGLASQTDVDSRAKLDASNLNASNITSWQTKLNIPAEGDYVTLDTEQTITGLKTFSTIKGRNGALNISVDNIYLATYIIDDEGIKSWTDNSRDLGSASAKFKDLYLGGNLTDGTNSVSIAEIATQEFVNNLVGDINTILDTINGEVV